MFGFNWVDMAVVLLLIATVVQGVRTGVLTQLFATTGFFVTFIAAGWLLSWALPIRDPTVHVMVSTFLVITIAAYAGVRSLDLAQRIHWSLRIGRLRDRPGFKRAETLLGALPGLATGLVMVWLLGVAIGRLPFAAFSNSVSDSRIVQQLTRSLPPVPAVFAFIGSQVDPNAQPHVYVQPKPYASFDYSAIDVQRAESWAAPSTVRVTSFACGGIIGATGFAIDSDLVATNAHVIAGAKRPIIKHMGKSYEAVPILFNATLDLAILRVPGLNATPLKLYKGSVALGTSAAVVGYPGGNYRAAPGIIRDTRALTAQNIYSQGDAGRGVYLVQATLDYGNSGGPVVLGNGEVAGMVFSKSVDMPDNAYALTSPHIAAALQQVQDSHRRVSTRGCVAE